MEYLPGGVESGFNKMEKDVFRNRLLHVKGKRVVRVSEVQCSTKIVAEKLEHTVKLLRCTVAVVSADLLATGDRRKLEVEEQEVVLHRRLFVTLERQRTPQKAT